MTLRYGILTIGTWDSFFPSSCFSGQNEMFSATKQNQTYNHSFFFIIVFLQFSLKFYFSDWLVLITNSKLVIYIGKRRGFSRSLWFSLEWTSPEKDTFLLDCIKIIFIYSYLMENFSLVNFHNLLGNPLIPIQDLNTNFLLEPKNRKAKIW